MTARIKDAEKAQKNSVLLLVSKGGKQTEMRFIALKIKKVGAPIAGYARIRSLAYNPADRAAR